MEREERVYEYCMYKGKKYFKVTRMKKIITILISLTVSIASAQVPVSDCGSDGVDVILNGNYKCGVNNLEFIEKASSDFYQGLPLRLTSRLTSGTENSAIGIDALRELTWGSDNTCVGSRACRDQTFPYYNVGIGHYTLGHNIEGSKNTVVGTFALKGHQGYTNVFNNVALGFRSMYLAYDASENVAIGNDSMALINDGRYNVSVGNYSLLHIDSGEGNTAVGRGAGYSVKNDFGNTLIGDQSAWNLENSNYNTIIGKDSGWATGSDSIGDSNTIIGAKVINLEPGLTDNIILSIGDGTIKARYKDGKWHLYGDLVVHSSRTEE